MVRDLIRTNNKRKNNELVNAIKSGLSDLRDEIKEMSENEIKIIKTDKMVDIIENIIEFNRQNQQEQGLKIFNPNQMLSRLPITLAQLKAGNNSEKRKNEIRQLLYSLNHSKKFSKAIFKHLISII